MAKNAEANLLLKVKEQGKEVLSKVGDNLESIRNKAALASAAILGFIGVTVKKYGEQEAAEKALTQSLKAQGLEVDSLFKKYTELASALQAKSTQDDTAIIKGIALAQSYAGQLTLTEDLIEATVDFAAATGMDLESAFTAVGKTIGTNTNALSRYGVEVSQNTSSAQKMETVVAKLDRTFGGFAESQRKGLGQLKALGENIDDLVESIGKRFAPSVSEAAEKLNNMIGNLSEQQIATIANWTAGILAAAAGVATLVAGLATLGVALPAITAGFGVLVALLTGPVGIAIGLTAVAAAAATASGALDGVIEKAKRAFGYSQPEERGDGTFVDERAAYMERRAKAEQLQLTKTADHSIAEEKRARDERAKIATELAEKRKEIEEDHLADLRKGQSQYEEWLTKDQEEKAKLRKESLQGIYNDPVKILFEDQVDSQELANAGAGLATGFLSALQQGADGASAFGGKIAEGVGNAIQEKLNGAIGDDALFGLGGLFKELFAFSAQTEEQIKAQTEAFVNAIPAIAENQVKFAPAMVEALINALGDPKFWEALAGASGRMISANTDALARQWGIKSGEHFLEEMERGVGNFFGYIRDFIKGIIDGAGNMLSGLGGVLGNAAETIVARIGNVFGASGTEMVTKLNEWLNGVGSKISESIGGLGEKISGFFSSAGDGIASALKTEFENLKGIVSDPFEGLRKAVEKLASIFNIGGGGGGGIVDTALGALGIKRANGGIVPGYANGGVVSGALQRLAAGGTTDTVPAMLTPGEFVINREATQKNLGLLSAINAGVSGGAGTNITIVVNGGLLGDESSARQLARAIDEQLLKLRQSNQSVAFEKGLF